MKKSVVSLILSLLSTSASAATGLEAWDGVYLAQYVDYCNNIKGRQMVANLRGQAQVIGNAGLGISKMSAGWTLENLADAQDSVLKEGPPGGPAICPLVLKEYSARIGK